MITPSFYGAKPPAEGFIYAKTDIYQLSCIPRHRKLYSFKCVDALWKSSWSVPLKNIEYFSFCPGESVSLKTLDYKQNQPTNQQTHGPVIRMKNFRSCLGIGTFSSSCAAPFHILWLMTCKHSPGNVGPEGPSRPLKGLFLGITVPLIFLIIPFLNFFLHQHPSQSLLFFPWPRA